jgi:hypothetical protein
MAKKKKGLKKLFKGKSGFVLFIVALFILVLLTGNYSTTFSFTLGVNPEETIDDTWGEIPLSGTIHTEQGIGVGDGERSGVGTASYNSNGDLVVSSSCAVDMNAYAKGWIEVTLEQDLNEVETAVIDMSGSMNILRSHHGDNQEGQQAIFSVRLVDADGTVISTLQSNDLATSHPDYDNYESGTRTESFNGLTVEGTNESYPVYIQFYAYSNCYSGRGMSNSASANIDSITYDYTVVEVEPEEEIILEEPIIEEEVEEVVEEEIIEEEEEVVLAPTITIIEDDDDEILVLDEEPTTFTAILESVWSWFTNLFK